MRQVSVPPAALPLPHTATESEPAIADHGEEARPRRPLARRLAALIGFLAVSAMLLVGGLAWRMAALTDAHERLLREDAGAAADVRRLQVEFKKQVQEWKDILLRGHRAEDLAHYTAAFEDQRRLVDSLAAHLLAGRVADSAARVHLEAFHRAHAALTARYADALATYRRDPTAPEAARAADALVRGADRPPTERIGQAVEALDATLAARAAALRARGVRERTVALVVLAALLLVVLLVFQRLVRAIVTPIAALQGAASRVARGDLRYDVPIGGHDEIGLLARAFRTMTIALRALLAAVGAEARGVASTSAELSDTTGQLDLASREVAVAAARIAAASHEQTRAIDRLRETATLVAERTRVVEEAATAGARAAERAAGDAGHARDAADRALVALDAVARTREETAPVLVTMRERAAAIDAIAVVVESIASQTHLLSINAAIEAARAGAEGRGFSVVAAEIRKLAQESADALGRIRDLTQAVTAAADDSVAAMARLQARVEDGEGTVREALDALRRIEEAATTALGAVLPVRDVAVRQRGSAQAMAEELGTLATSAWDNAAAAEEVSASIAQQTAALSQVAAATSALRDVAARLEGRTGGFAVAQ
jgi:methyl-accepting chemotaxis protein